MLYLGLLLSSVSLFALLVESGTVPIGSNCSSISDHLDPLTHKFLSSCVDTGFCSGHVNGTCIPKRCRRDEFPFEYAFAGGGNSSVPPMCKKGTFCPDEGSGCRPLVPVGAMCQLDRDEQCAPPENWLELSMASAQNFNGSVCLRSTCTYANVTLGESCILEKTTYYSDVVDPNGQRFGINVTRSNCKAPEFFCDPTSLVCQRTNVIGAPCTANEECEQLNCSSKGLCVAPPGKALKVAPWHYTITAFFVFAAMTVTCVALTFMHKRHRYAHYQEVRDYYLEQISLRRSIVALHSEVSLNLIGEKTQLLSSS